MLALSSAPQGTETTNSGFLSARRTIARIAEMEPLEGAWRTAKSAGIHRSMGALHDLPPCRI
jgi:hypothetical protein